MPITSKKQHRMSSTKKQTQKKNKSQKKQDIDTEQQLPKKVNNPPEIQPQILIGFPNHLFKLENWQLANINQIPTHFILYEHPLFYGHRTTPGKLMYNKIRLIYVRAAILAYLEYLNQQIIPKTTKKQKSDNKPLLLSISFVSVDDCLGNSHALANHIAKLQKDHKLTPETTPIKYWDPVDVELTNDQMQKLCNGAGAKTNSNITKLDSPLFITSESSLAEYHSKHKTGRFTHSAFYNWQKTRPEMKDFKFPGHSYDTENRGQMPLTTHIPPLPKLTANDLKHLLAAEKYISAHAEWGNKSRPGSAYTHTNIVFPISFEATHDWFQNFLAKKLSHFGKYQDSIDGQARNYLFHSCISPMMNLGLITPYEVITAAHKYYQAHQSEVGVANYEGFIRQVIGWREYQRYIYLYAGDKMRKSNYFNNHGKLTPAWYTGNLGVRPVDDAIKMAFRDGYLHHILRLMVMGNFMNLAGLHPDEVYRWFMEFALDSYDWVMVGNVYSMAMWADGGLSMRKPYISSDTYIMTLGTYAKESTTTHSTHADSESSDNTSTSKSSSSSNNSSSRDTNTRNEENKETKDTKTNKKLGWNRVWYVLFYDFINRSQTQLQSTYYAGLVKAWHNKSETEKQNILKDAKKVKSAF